MGRSENVAWVEVHYVGSIPPKWLILRDRVIRWVRSRDYQAIEDAIEGPDAKKGRPREPWRKQAIVAAVKGLREHKRLPLTGESGAFAVVAEAFGRSASRVEQIWYEQPP